MTLTSMLFITVYDLTGCVTDSMDVAFLYPSIDIDFAVENYVERFGKSNVEFCRVDREELGLLLRLMTLAVSVSVDQYEVDLLSPQWPRRPPMESWNKWTKAIWFPKNYDQARNIIAHVANASTKLKRHLRGTCLSSILKYIPTERSSYWCQYHWQCGQPLYVTVRQETQRTLSRDP